MSLRGLQRGYSGADRRRNKEAFWELQGVMENRCISGIHGRAGVNVKGRGVAQGKRKGHGFPSMSLR